MPRSEYNLFIQSSISPINNNITNKHNMALPILVSPKYTLTIPSTGKTISYRPFLVKEEKILLIAQESSDNEEIINAMKNIVKACTFDKVEPNELTTFDLEYIFLKLRAKSVGELTDINCKCSKCEAFTKSTINIDEIVFDIDPRKNKVIMLTDTVGLNMRYIQVKDMNVLMKDSSAKGEMITDLVIASITSIFDAGGVYPADQTAREEMETFINSLNRSQMKLIETFIAEAPKLTHDLEFVCSSCKEKNKLTLTGAQSFFE